MCASQVSQKKVSAILPNYNSSLYLKRSIDSLIAQTESFDEIIIVDDGSTDQSLAIIEPYIRNYSNIFLVQHEKNQGVAAALNSGIDVVTGDYILLAAADDWYEKDLVSRAKKVMEKHPTVGLICGDALVSRFDLKHAFRRSLPFKPVNTAIDPKAFAKIAKNSYVGFNGGGSMFLKREQVLALGKLEPRLKWHCDWLLYFAVAITCGIYYIDEIFVHIDMRQNGYAEGKRNWPVQKKVMIDTISIIKHQHPKLWPIFKETGLLPHYSFRYIPLFLSEPLLRDYLSLSLLWKILINNSLVTKIGRFFPYRIALQVRKLLRA